MHDQAEKLKTRFGSALAKEIVDNRIITIPGIKGREPKEISEKNLSRIIQARMEEIFRLYPFRDQTIRLREEVDCRYGANRGWSIVEKH